MHNDRADKTIDGVLSLATHALEWSGPGGRLAKTIQLAREFVQDASTTRLHLHILKELVEIADIYSMWKPHINLYPGLQEKIGESFNKGTLLREDENPESQSNRPRNDLFAYALAARFIKANIKVLAVEGCAITGMTWHSNSDISIAFSNHLIDVECKRPQSEASVSKRIKEGLRQLTGALPPEMVGLIAIDCSALPRPTKEFLDRLSGRDLDAALSLFLLDQVPKQVASRLPGNILGILLNFRLPSYTAAIANLQQEDGNAKRVSYYSQTTYKRLMPYPNNNCQHQNVLHMLSDALAKSISV